LNSLEKIDVFKPSSNDYFLTEPAYLDSHFLAAKDEYVRMLYFAGLKKGFKIIDAGCGSGSYIPHISSIIGNSGEIHAVDISEENIEIAKSLIEKHKNLVPTIIQKGDIRKLAFENNSFDAVWCSNVFQYLTEIEKEIVLKEFKRVVRPGGIIAIKELDLSASYIGLDPLTLNRIIKKSNSSIQLQSTFKTFNLTHLNSKIGFQGIKYRTFNVEWTQPVPKEVMPYLKSIILSFGLHVQNFEINKKDLMTINSLFDPQSEKYYLNSPDFYWRESFGVAIYRV